MTFELTITAGDEQTMQRIGDVLSRVCSAPALVFFNGDLGTGKTTIIRAWLRAEGVKGSIKSPTYTYLEVYEETGEVLAHMDCYRIEEPETAHTIGLPEACVDADKIFVEWPNKVASTLPNPDLTLALQHESKGRSIQLKAHNAKAKAWLEQFNNLWQA